MTVADYWAKNYSKFVKTVGAKVPTQDVEDVVGDAAIYFCSKYTPDRGALSTFAYHCLFYAVRQYWKKRNSAPPVGFTEELMVEPSYTMDFDASFGPALDYPELYAALSELPLRQRQIICEFANKIPERVSAEKHDISKSRVWQVRRQALKQLKSLMTEAA